jgi:hypothetical protein
MGQLSPMKSSQHNFECIGERKRNGTIGKMVLHCLRRAELQSMSPYDRLLSSPEPLIHIERSSVKHSRLH